MKEQQAQPVQTSATSAPPTGSHFSKLMELIEGSEWRKALSRAGKTYNIKVYNLEKLTLNRVKEIYHTIAEKFYVGEKQKDNWNENELRVFVWLLFAYANSLQKSPDEFTQENWTAIAGCFQGKSVSICEFQYNSLKKLSEKAIKWVEHEDELLASILQEKEAKNRWNEVAKEFFVKSQKRYFRTSKQCRERWNNYLDPMKRHSGWNIEEDITLIETVFDKGKKWALIAKMLDGRRTEHMVKNRFNSLMCKFLKCNSSKKYSSDNVPLEVFKQWLLTRTEKQKDKEPAATKPPKASRIKQEVPAEVERPPRPQQKPHFVVPEQKKQDDRGTQNSFREVKSPLVIVTPMMPTVYTPLVFSPYPQFNAYFMYKNQTAQGEQGRGESDTVMDFNPFGFHNLMR